MHRRPSTSVFTRFLAACWWNAVTYSLYLDLTSEIIDIAILHTDHDKATLQISLIQSGQYCLRSLTPIHANHRASP